MDWFDWLSNKKRYNEVLISVRQIDERRVDEFINKLKEKYPEDTSVMELTTYLEIINKSFRYQQKGLDHVYAMDCMENNGDWYPYKEDFADCLNRLIEAYEVEF